MSFFFWCNGCLQQPPPAGGLFALLDAKEKPANGFSFTHPLPLRGIKASFEIVQFCQIEKTSQMTGLFYLVSTVVYDNRPLRRGYPLRSTRRRNPQMVPPSHILFLARASKLHFRGRFSPVLMRINRLFFFTFFGSNMRIFKKAPI